jgi:hypothetical protein
VHEKRDTRMNPAFSMPVELAPRRVAAPSGRAPSAAHPAVGGTVVTLLGPAFGGLGAPSNEPPDLTA